MLSCPVCRSRSIRRSVRRTFMERFWSLGGRYPFRCYDCNTRFFAYHLPGQEEVKPETKSVPATVDEDDD